MRAFHRVRSTVVISRLSDGTIETTRAPLRIRFLMPQQHSSKTVVARLLGTSSQPVYLLDERRHIAFCNAACARWLRVDAAALIGLRCDYHSGGDATSIGLAAGLCPPPEVFQGRAMTAEVSCHDATGQLQRRQAEFRPLPHERPDRIAVLAFVEAENLPDAPPAQNASSDTPTELHQRLRALLHGLRGRYRVDQIIGESPAIVRVRDQVRLAIAGAARVVVVGPPGSGCEHVARCIHYGSPAHNTPPMTPLDCRLLDPELLRSTVTSFIASCAELDSEQPPALLLLDVDQLAPETQVALAELLNIRALHLRTLATARVPLAQLVETHRFRRDLAYTLSTLVIEIPPLAERPQDIPLLAQLFLEQTNAAGGTQRAGFAETALDELLAYPWPRNVEELAEFVQSACQRTPGPLVPAAALPERMRLTAAAAAHPPRPEPAIAMDAFLEEIEQELLLRALQQAKGNKAHAARLLGIDRARLLRRLGYFRLM